ncbi:hypothetical protein FLAN108750_05440 [Flavobacterium antarcticum]|uniref:hypothetical protein n=1 Tax=Flavobacterium antarcticum TaxID=271155 RepID=UPI0003B5A2E6|nr:hypothetical protein [Flavobacterium antarcticum]
MKFKKILFFIFIIGILSCGIFVVGYFANIVFPWQREESIEATIEMGGLSQLPKNIENVEIEKRGSTFTRQYIIEFDSNQIEIQRWIENSKRLKNAIPKFKGKTKVYEIYPGENGAMGGKVEIKNNRVLINMSWS